MDREQIDLAYLAGFFDGEGCITRGRKHGRWYLKVTLVQKDEQPLRRLRRRFGGTISNHDHGRTRQWEVSYRKARIVLRTLLPYLEVKRGRALEALFVHPAELKGVRG